MQSEKKSKFSGKIFRSNLNRLQENILFNLQYIFMEEPNFTYLNSFTAGDKAFEEKILKIIITEFPEEKNLYLNNIVLNKLDEAANNVHKIKHKISLLGLEESYGLASQHELNLINDNTTLHEDFTEILNTMNRFLKEL